MLNIHQKKKPKRVRDGDQVFIGIRTRKGPESYLVFRYTTIDTPGSKDPDEKITDEGFLGLFESGADPDRDLVRIRKDVPKEDLNWENLGQPQKSPHESSYLKNGDRYLKNGDTVSLSTVENGDFITTHATGRLILGFEDGSHLWTIRKKDGKSTIRYGDPIVLTPPGHTNRRWCPHNHIFLGTASLSTLCLRPKTHPLPPRPRDTENGASQNSDSHNLRAPKESKSSGTTPKKPKESRNPMMNLILLIIVLFFVFLFVYAAISICSSVIRSSRSLLQGQKINSPKLAGVSNKSLSQGPQLLEVTD